MEHWGVYVANKETFHNTWLPLRRKTIVAVIRRQRQMNEWVSEWKTTPMRWPLEGLLLPLPPSVHPRIQRGTGHVESHPHRLRTDSETKDLGAWKSLSETCLPRVEFASGKKTPEVRVPLIKLHHPECVDVRTLMQCCSAARTRNLKHRTLSLLRNTNQKNAKINTNQDRPYNVLIAQVVISSEIISAWKVLLPELVCLLHRLEEQHLHGLIRNVAIRDDLESGETYQLKTTTIKHHIPLWEAIDLSKETLAVRLVEVWSKHMCGPRK